MITVLHFDRRKIYGKGQAASGFCFLPQYINNMRIRRKNKMLVILFGDPGVGRKTFIERVKGAKCLDIDNCTVTDEDDACHQIRAPMLDTESTSLGDVGHLILMYNTQNRTSFDHLMNWSSTFLGVAGTPPKVHTSISLLGTHIDQGPVFQGHDDMVKALVSVLLEHYKSADARTVSTLCDTPESLRSILPTPTFKPSPSPKTSWPVMCSICTG